MPSPNIMAAALTRRTSRAAIVDLGNSIALYNPPLRVAEEFAMLDVISGGRLVAGFPVGTSMDTNFCYGTIPAETRSRYDEAHEAYAKAVGLMVYPPEEMLANQEAFEAFYRVLNRDREDGQEDAGADEPPPRPAGRPVNDDRKMP